MQFVRIVFGRLATSIATSLLLLALLAGLGPLAVDPTYFNLGPEFGPEDVARIREELGLSGSFEQRFVRSVADVATLKLGHSLRVGSPVGELVVSRIGVTALVVLPAVIISILAGSFLALLFARHQRARQFGLTLVTLVGMGVPLFILASLVAEFLPGLTNSEISRTALGAGLLALPGTAFYALTLTRRLSALEQERFVLYGQALGLPERTLQRWSFRLAFVEALAVTGNQLAIAVSGGTIVVEYALRLEGVGLLLLDAATWMDLPVLRVLLVGASLALGIGFLLLDILHSLLDPRRAV